MSGWVRAWVGGCVGRWVGGCVGGWVVTSANANTNADTNTPLKFEPEAVQALIDNVANRVANNGERGCRYAHATPMRPTYDPVRPHTTPYRPRYDPVSTPFDDLSTYTTPIRPYLPSTDPPQHIYHLTTLPPVTSQLWSWVSTLLSKCMFGQCYTRAMVRLSRSRRLHQHHRRHWRRRRHRRRRRSRRH